jgi:eukaryotic-like serine/threonine-protein kinase
MDETPKRHPSDQPAQSGSAAAVSNSGENLDAGATVVPQSRSDQAMPPTSTSDETILVVPGRTPHAGAAKRSEWSAGSGDSNPELHPAVQPGSILAHRYEILSLLGTGGMGSVYKAQDQELDRLVALKVIRPEMARNPAIVDRFKQELRLSHKVTHRNVVRMYDLSEDAGMRFVTMELVAGRDLRSILEERRKLPPDEAVDVLEQICVALKATHGVGILHRDLKPQNVMREDGGRVVVMDFGMARAIDSNDGLTQTGALIGTLDYMSPEQALGKKLDHRSDIFTFGLIGYELLTGAMPFRADSAIASLLNRTQQRAVPMKEIDKSIPGGLSDIIAKCLEKEPENRYQSAEELDADLRAWQDRTSGKKASTSLAQPGKSRIQELQWPRFALIGLLIVAIGLGIALLVSRRQQDAKPVAHVPVSVLVGDFANHTGDAVLDNTLEPMLGLALEGASFINTYSRGEARKQAAKLPNPTDKLDEQSARLIALNQGVHAVVTGEINLRGSEYDISATAVDAVSGKVLAKSDVTVADKQEIVGSLPKLAAPIRQALGDTTPASVQFGEVSGGFIAGSLEAVHQDALGVDEQFAGQWQEAFDSFQKAAQYDPNFARAYSGMAAMANNLGRPADAAKYMKLAMAHVDRMTERERYRDRGLYYLTAGDWQDCVQQNTQLVTRYPADRVGANNLASCYTGLRNAPKAVEAAQHAVEILPKGVGQRLNLGYIEAFAGDFADSEKEAHTALGINPKAAQGYLVLAEALIGQAQIDKAAEAYRQLQSLGAASTATAGLADLAAYQGKYAEAARLLTQGAAADLAGKDLDSAARKYAALGNIEELQGNHASALADTGKALENSKATPIEFLAARTYVDAGDIPKAQKLAASLSSSTTSESQAYGKIIAGLIALKRKDANEAVRQITSANNLLDTWIGRYDLGRAHLEAGAFTEADADFDECANRRGEAIELFLDNVPTYAWFPPVYYYQGRAREGMKSAGFADFYKTYLGIRGQSPDDPLVSDIKRRMGN